MRVFPTNDNLGYFGGAVFGIEKSGLTVADYDYTIISNVDLLLSEDFFKKLYSERIENYVGCIAPSIISRGERFNRNPKVLTRYSAKKLKILRVMFRFPALWKMYNTFLHGKRREKIQNEYTTEIEIYAAHALYIFDLKVPEIFEDRKRPRKKGQTFGERDNLGQVEQVKQTLPRKGFYAGDVANTFSVPVGVHQEETKFKQMDGYVSIGMLNGLKEELGSDQTVVEEINDLSEKPELQETAKKESESESGTQVDPAQETEELRKGQIYGNDTIHTVGG